MAHRQFWWNKQSVGILAGSMIKHEAASDLLSVRSQAPLGWVASKRASNGCAAIANMGLNELYDACRSRKKIPHFGVQGTNKTETHHPNKVYSDLLKKAKK